MNQFRVIATIAVLAIAAGAGAATGQAVNHDGSVHPEATGHADLAATAASALRRDDVPSVKTDPPDLKAQADADLRQRHVVPHLKAQRENLKGDAARHAITQRQNPSTYDRAIQNGDIDHTEQVTDLKVTIKK